MNVRHLILDRDGVLNIEGPSGWVTRPEEWVWERFALDGLVRLAAGRRVSVVTNQSCVGRGLTDMAAVRAVHEHMKAGAVAAGARIDTVLICPHAPDEGCICRKPAPGLVLEAIRRSGVPPAETLMVGDSSRDLEAGRFAGVRVALVLTGKGRMTALTPAAAGVRAFEDLGDLADFLGEP